MYEVIVGGCLCQVAFGVYTLPECYGDGVGACVFERRQESVRYLNGTGGSPVLGLENVAIFENVFSELPVEVCADFVDISECLGESCCLKTRDRESLPYIVVCNPVEFIISEASMPVLCGLTHFLLIGSSVLPVIHPCNVNTHSSSMSVSGLAGWTMR